MRVLLVEDHEEIWDFLSRRLKRRGIDVTVATDGQAGVDRARADLPDIVLLDMNLPILDGWSAARVLKSDPATAGIPIIALTAHAMAGDRGEDRRRRLRRLSSQARGFLQAAAADRDAGGRDRRAGLAGVEATAWGTGAGSWLCQAGLPTCRGRPG